MEHKDGALATTEDWEPLGTSSVDTPKRENAEDYEWRGCRGAFLEEVGKKPKLWKE